MRVIVECEIGMLDKTTQCLRDYLSKNNSPESGRRVTTFFLGSEFLITTNKVGTKIKHVAAPRKTAKP
jgi:hypothetical protein